MELRLAVEAHRRQHVEGQTGVAGERGGQAEPLRDLHLFLDLRDVTLVERVYEGGPVLDIGVNAIGGSKTPISLTPAPCASA